VSELNELVSQGDFERQFGGLRRLYGVAGAQRIFDAHVVVVGIGGVGSWAVEALARSGVRCLTLVDLDHVSESNFNRQIHANSLTLGQSKADAMRERIALFHSTCQVIVVDDFVTPENWVEMVERVSATGGAPQIVIDACDQVPAKVAMAAWALKAKVPCVVVGAAGGKRLPHAVEVDDLANVSHDPLLAKLRYQLRRHHGASRTGRIQVTCVFSREPVAPPDASCEIASGDGSLNCHGYGSAVGVTAAFGMAAAGWAMNTLATSLKTSLPNFEKAKKDAII
jgi:tRNA A37 threonylcarbamoyladenosine dehydratase